MKTHDSKNQPLASAVPNAFYQAYVEAALWSSSYTAYETPEDEETQENGEDHNMDDGVYELATETEDAMLHDCAAWFRHCEQSDLPAVPEYDCPQYSDEEKSGHDLWLTRCHHGAGYWDRDLGELGDKLTEAAHAMGSRDLYVGDDGLIYQS